jgi:hypothetical protein
MAKEVELKVKQNFTDKETKVDYKKGKTYKFSEKRAEELLKNPYIVEKVNVTEVEEKAEEQDAKTEENAPKK